MFGLHEVNKAWGNTFDEEEVLEEHSEVQHWDFLHSPSHQGHDVDYGNRRGKFQALSFTYHLLNRSRVESQGWRVEISVKIYFCDKESLW